MMRRNILLALFFFLFSLPRLTFAQTIVEVEIVGQAVPDYVAGIDKAIPSWSVHPDRAKRSFYRKGSETPVDPAHPDYPAPDQPEVFAPELVTDSTLFRGTFSPDGNTLYFFRKVTPGKEHYRIFQSKLENGRWSPPVRLAPGGDYSDLYPTVSPDGERLVFTSYRPVPGDTSSYRNANLWYVERQRNGWGSPVYMAEASTPANYDAGPLFGPGGAVYFHSVEPDWQTQHSRITRWNGTAFGPPEPFEAVDQWRNWRPDLYLWEGTAGPDGTYVVLTFSTRDATTSRLSPPIFLVTHLRDDRWTEPRLPDHGFDLSGANFLTFSPNGKNLFFVKNNHTFYRVSIDAFLAETKDFDAAIELGRAEMRRLVGEVPGASVAVAVDGDVVWTEGFGFADVERGEPATADTRFGLGSISKTLTMAAVMRLVDEGLLNLDAPIEHYLPDFPHRGQGVTIRRLAAHQSGISDVFATEHYETTEHFPSIDSAYEHIKQGPMIYTPGTQTRYATGVYTIIGRALEAVTGRSYLDIMREYLFDPIGMQLTGPNDATLPVAGRTRFYVEGEDGGFEPGPAYDPSFKLPGAGFMATAGDVARFGAALIESRLLSPEAQQEMFRTVPLIDGTPTEFALGLRRGEDQGRLVLHQPGGGIGISAWLFLYPEEDLVIAILSNVSTAPVGGRAYQEIAAAFLETITARAQPGPSTGR